MKGAASTIENEVRLVVEDLCRSSQFAPETLLVLGCSTSEIAGELIGSAGSVELGEAVVRGVLSVTRLKGLYLAVQCCEHLNRALVVERKAAQLFHCEQVSVRPVRHAGGAAATAAMKLFDEPVVVLAIQAGGGLDIGGTMIGMHLHRVAVPVRLEHYRVGKAFVIAAKTRPMLVGGERAQY